MSLVAFWIAGSITELDPVWLLTCGTRGLWSVFKAIDFTTMHSHDSWHASARATASLSICLYLVSMGGIALTWTILASIQELSAWSWKMTTTKPCSGHIRLVPRLMQGRLWFAWKRSADHFSRSTGSLSEAVLWCSSTCQQDVVRTSLIGSSQEMCSLFAKFCGGGGSAIAWNFTVSSSMALEVMTWQR